MSNGPEVAPPRITIGFQNLLREVPVLLLPVDIYLHIVGSFSLDVSDRVIYKEEIFPVVEFAIKSQTWSSEVDLTLEDFIFTSLDAEEELIWFKRQDAGWTVGSAYQENECVVPLDLKEIQESLASYYSELCNSVKVQFSIDIEELFEWKGKRMSPRAST